MLVSKQGNVIKSEIAGFIRVRCFLSGMPELKLGNTKKKKILGVFLFILFFIYFQRHQR